MSHIILTPSLADLMDESDMLRSFKHRKVMNITKQLPGMIELNELTISPVRKVFQFSG